MEGPTEKFIKTGSGLFLKCTFHKLSGPPDFVFWLVSTCYIFVILDGIKKIRHLVRTNKSLQCHTYFQGYAIAVIFGCISYKFNYVKQYQYKRHNIPSVHTSMNSQ